MEQNNENKIENDDLGTSPAPLIGQNIEPVLPLSDIPAKSIDPAKPTKYENLFRGIFTRGKVLDNEVDEINRFCETVYFKHFSYKKEQKDDLIQEGFIGLLELVKADNYIRGTPTLGFAYTRVRNCMGNYLTKKTPETFEEYPEKFQKAPAEGSENYEIILDKIFAFIDECMSIWEVSGLQRLYIEIYFRDKFGALVVPPQVEDVTFDFIIEYEFYVNLLEYQIAQKFLNGKIFSNDVRSILKVVEEEGELQLITKLLSKTFERESVIKILYILSGASVKYPSKRKLMRTDYYLSIYNSIKQGRYSPEEASKFYDKPVDSVLTIEVKFDKIFRKKHDS